MKPNVFMIALGLNHGLTNEVCEWQSTSACSCGPKQPRWDSPVFPFEVEDIAQPSFLKPLSSFSNDNIRISLYTNLCCWSNVVKCNNEMVEDKWMKVAGKSKRKNTGHRKRIWGRYRHFVAWRSKTIRNRTKYLLVGSGLLHRNVIQLEWRWALHF